MYLSIRCWGSGLVVLVVFFFNDTATTEIYTLSLHDALPISRGRPHGSRNVLRAVYAAGDAAGLNGEARERVGVHDLRHSFVAVAPAAAHPARGRGAGAPRCSVVRKVTAADRGSFVISPPWCLLTTAGVSSSRLTFGFKPPSLTTDSSLLPLKMDKNNTNTLRTSRKIDAASSGAVRMSFACRSRWKSNRISPAKMTRPATA